MISMNLKSLASILNGSFTDPAANTAASFCGVSIDSRTIAQGQLFVAIPGEKFDGHQYAAAAAQKGAGCIVAEHPVELAAGCSTPVLLVDDTISALGQLAAWYRKQLKASVIAITGSAGKTTTRQVLYQVLSRFYKCRQAQKSFNNHIGVPLTIMSAEMEDEILILELGTNHPGEIAYLTNLSKPDRAVVTFIGPAHLEGFGSLDNILREKASIAEGLPAGATIYANGDQPELIQYLKQNYDVRVVTFGTTAACDIIGSQLTTSGSGGSLIIDGTPVQVPLPGRANLLNALTVWSVCRDFDISLSDFTAAVARIEPIAMRMELQTIGPLTVLNDCYNANPASMANALSCLKSMAAERAARSVFVAGCMGELGDQSAMLHHQLGHTAAAEGIRVLLAAGPFAKEILEGARQGTSDMQMQSFENTAQLCDNLHKWIQKDDIVLVKGSRSAGLEKALLKLHELFNKK